MRKVYWISITFFTLFFLVGRAQKCPDRQGFFTAIEKTQGLDNNQKAIQQLKELQTNWQRCYQPNDSIYARIVHLLGRRFWLLGQDTHNNVDFKTAEQYTLAAIKTNSLSIASVSRANLVNSFLNLGILHYDHLNLQEQSVASFTKCVQIANQFPHKLSLAAEAALYLVKYHGSKGDYFKAIHWSSSAFDIAHRAKDSYFEVWALDEKVHYQMFLQEWQKARNTLQKQIKIIETSHQSEYLGLAFLKLAELARQQKKFNEMNHWFTKALDTYRSQKDTLQMAVSLNNWGFGLMNDAKDYESAQQKFERALNLNQLPKLRARILDNFGYLKKQQKKYIEALSCFDQAVKLLVPNRLILSAKNIRDTPKRDYLFDILQDKADTWLDYYKATKTKNHLTNALKTYALADSMIDFMRYEHAGEGSKLFWRQKTRGMYERAIEAAYLAGDAAAAFRFFEKSKAVLLADKLNELGANQQLSEADTRRQRGLRDSIANLQNQLAILAPNDSKRPVLQSRLERFNDDFEAFRKNLEKTNPAYYRYKYDSSTPNLTTFQQFLTSVEGGPNKAFVSYFVGDSTVYAFVVNGKNIKHHKLNLAPAAYLTTANEFLNLCANRAALNAQYLRYRALAYTLYEQLWKPLNISTARVVIAQDGVFLPFEAFLSQPNGNAFLLKKHAISYTYSAKFLQKSNRDLDPTYGRDDKIWARTFIGFAPENFTATLKQVPLNGSGEVLQDIGKGFWFGKKLVNAAATKANFMHYAPAARVIQLFTHADADSTDATEPKIYFQDAALRLSELNQTDGFAAQLLVLSACKTGVGQNQRGEGVFSLARGFAALGISSTVTTLWNVEDQPTYALTKLFYGYLDQNQPKDLALQKAKLDWLAQGGAADALPSQWAGMILVGDAAPLTLSPFGTLAIALVIPTMGGILLLLWWRKRKRTN